MGRMDIEIRSATPQEMGQLGLIGAYVYGGSFGDGPENTVSQSNRPEWTLGAFHGDQMVASYATIPFTMRVNGNAIALGGVSAVGTLPEYRRQGLARRLTTRAFEDMCERGQPLAALWASQAAIYQRYGYAQVADDRRYAIDTVDIGFFDGDPGPGRVKLLDAEAAYNTVKALYIAFIADRMCYLHRARPLWENNAFASRSEDGPVHVAVSHDEHGEADGYAIYTLRSDRVGHPARSQELVVRDLAWLSTDAYRSLWSWFARHDLVGRVRWDRAPVDDPAPQLMVEPRLLNATATEGLWLRVVDVESALAGRGYRNGGSADTEADGEAPIEVTIEISDDDLTPWNTGTYRLSVTDGRAEVSGTPGRGELVMAVRTLALLYAGTYPARQLAAWGLIEGEPSALTRADRIFATANGPSCPDNF